MHLPAFPLVFQMHQKHSDLQKWERVCLLRGWRHVNSILTLALCENESISQPATQMSCSTQPACFTKSNSTSVIFRRQQVLRNMKGCDIWNVSIFRHLVLVEVIVITSILKQKHCPATSFSIPFVPLEALLSVAKRSKQILFFISINVQPWKYFQSEITGVI